MYFSHSLYFATFFPQAWYPSWPTANIKKKAQYIANNVSGNKNLFEVYFLDMNMVKKKERKKEKHHSTCCKGMQFSHVS